VTHIVSENKITKISEYLLRDVIPIRSNYLMTKPWIRRQHDTFVFQYCWVSAPFLRYIALEKLLDVILGRSSEVTRSAIMYDFLLICCGTRDEKLPRDPSIMCTSLSYVRSDVRLH